MVFGASLGLAAEVAGRLVVLLVALTGFVWLGVWLINSLMRIMRPHAVSLTNRILDWSRNHPHIRPLAGSLLDPDHPEARGLATLSMLLFVTLWLLLLISSPVLHGQLLAGIDAYIFHTLDQLRTPWVDTVMVFFTGLGNQLLLAVVLAGSIAWLLWQGRIQAAVHWLAAYLCAGLLTWILKVTTGIARPLESIGGYSFPSAHTSMSLVVYGFLALLIARELPIARRWLPYSMAGLLILLIALSRVYLGAHWFSDVLAGLSLGIFWVALIGIAYDRHRAPALPVRQLLLVTGVLLLVAVSWQTRQHFSRELALYEPRLQMQSIGQTDWVKGGWESLPAYRIDLEGGHSQPINFQWGGSLVTLQLALIKQGWQPAPTLNPVSAMNWLAPKPDINTLPVLPEVHDGQHQVLFMIAPRKAGEELLTVVRLWPSNRRLAGSGNPIWMGKVASLYVESQLPLVSYLRPSDNYVAPLEKLLSTLQHRTSIETRSVSRAEPVTEINWQGQVLLAWEAAS
jgi:undecaprenyl-diphosphatase